MKRKRAAICENAEGVSPPHDPHPLTPSEIAALGADVQQELRNARRSGESSAAEGVSRIYQVVAPMIASDAHWSAGIALWAIRHPFVPINSGKRTDTVCKFMCGPDGLDTPEWPDVTLAQLPDKLSWKDANRISHIVLELMQRHVLPAEALNYMLHTKKPHVLLRERRERRKSGTMPLEPGTAQGATLGGRPLTVIVSPEIGPLLEGGTTSNRPLAAVQRPSADGQVVVDIVGEMKPAPIKPELPPGAMQVALVGNHPNLKALSKSEVEPVLVRARRVSFENGQHTFQLLEVRAAPEMTGAAPAPAARGGTITTAAPTARTTRQRGLATGKPPTVPSIPKAPPKVFGGQTRRVEQPPRLPTPSLPPVRRLPLGVASGRPGLGKRR